MSATNQTTYYDLPLFIGTDVPSWLGDWNNAMNAIDGAINGVKTAADSATNVANTAEGKSDANTETINALTAEVNTLKQAVQNYDSILDFNNVPVVLNPNNINNTTQSSSFFMVQNTNKTLNKMTVGIWTSELTNPTTFQYTGESGSYTWYELATVEDNCLKLNQGSLPNDNICLSVGILTMILLSTTKTIAGCNYLRAWYDGATTHFGFTSNSAINNLKELYLIGDFTVFLSGTVYSPDDPTTGDS